jgi:hypothetical protein
LIASYPTWARRNVVACYGLPSKGYFAFMRTDDDTRSLEQEVAAGQSETTPVAVITSVVGVIAILFVVALLLAVVAYLVA